MSGVNEAMVQKKRGLGRGLDVLLGAPAVRTEGGHDGVLRKLGVELLERGPYQPRHEIQPEALSDLADSIRAQGVVQPIVARAVAGGRYQIIAGERRWRAAQMAGLSEVPVLLREVSDQAALAMALIENIQRENLSAMEEAKALARLVDEFSLTHQQAADAVGRSRSAVSNLMRLLDLAPKVQELVQAGKLDMGHARALLALAPEQQLEAARQITLRGLSVRETEALVKRLLSGAPARPPKPPTDPDIQRLADRLGQTLGARVSLDHQPTGKGKVVIHYNSLDELDGILSHLD